jgi:hypothetical protein
VGTNSDGVEIEAAGDVRAGYSDLKGWSSDIVIRGNEVVDTGLVGVPSGIPRGIFVGVDGDEGPAPNASTTGRAHQNVRVVDNVVRSTGGHAIEVADTAGVTLAGNRIETFGVLSDVDVARYGLGIRHASDVTVRDNVVRTDDSDAGFGWAHESDIADVGGNSFVVGGSGRGADLVDLGE